MRDSLTLVALLVYLLWLNWKLTLFVALLLPAVALVMRTLSKRLHRLTIAGQPATDELAYVVEENVLAWRIVRLHGAAGRAEAGASARAATRCAAWRSSPWPPRDDDADDADRSPPARCRR